MSDRRSEIIILGEDRQQLVFLRRFLKGVDPGRKRFRNVREVSPPAGVGSGEQFVRNRYPLELRQYRGQVTRSAVKLAVLIDADTHTVDERFQHLVTALTDGGLTQGDCVHKSFADNEIKN